MGEFIDIDQEHLRLLKLGFYIVAGFSAVTLMILLLYVGVASTLISTAAAKNGAGDFPLWIIPVIGSVFLLFGAAVTFLMWFVGRSLGERRRRTFCMIVAGICCLQVPFGTVLGVCALIVLGRPSVKALFDSHALPPPIWPAQPLG